MNQTNEMFDSTDLAILSVLQKDGRASYSSIARELDLPESTVRIRAQKILNSGFLSIVATGDPLKLGIPIDVLCLVRVEPEQAHEVADAIAQMKQVRYVGVTLGGKILLVESLHPSSKALHDYLARELPSMAGVKEVESHQIMEIRKSVWDWQSWLGEANLVSRRLNARVEEVREA